MMCNGLKISEYEVYWLTKFLFGLVPRNNYGDLSKKKQNKQVLGKINLAVNRDLSYIK